MREIEEECGIVLVPSTMREAGFAADDPLRVSAGSAAILLLLIHCVDWTGTPRSREGGEWGWFTPAEIARLERPPLDRELANRFFGQ